MVDEKEDEKKDSEEVKEVIHYFSKSAEFHKPPLCFLAEFLTSKYPPNMGSKGLAIR